MVTCYLRYVLDPHKLEEFEHYGRLWMPLVEKFGGRHHGCFLPHEGASSIAYALFSFPTLADYEQYRVRSQDDEACEAARRYAQETHCILSVERDFLRPMQREARA
ncbi:MAG TPA: NIPSNAP family protein [Noviherbaspirillum sp.]|nr:NIPSNAP family protein [Noviherbaspirillum sp.]